MLVFSPEPLPVFLHDNSWLWPKRKNWGQERVWFYICNLWQCLLEASRLLSQIRVWIDFLVQLHLSYVCLIRVVRAPSTAAVLRTLLYLVWAERCDFPETGVAAGLKWKGKWSRSVVFDSLRPHGLQPTRLLCPWDSPGKSTGVGCHSLLQGIFLTQGSNSGSCIEGRFFTIWATREAGLNYS